LWNTSNLIKIQLPDLGEGTKEATVKEWFVKEGAVVDEFEDLCEVFGAGRGVLGDFIYVSVYIT
jgi:hypothetical protein